VPETEKAKQGILAVAQAYADAAEKRLGEGKIDEFLEQNRRAEETARSLPEGSELATRLQARRNALRDEALAAAKKAAPAWDRTAALAAYDRALKLDPNNAEVLRGRKAAERVGEIGYVFRDTAEAPEMVIVSTGGRKLAVARTEITLGEYRRYWSARGAKTRAAGRASCRDRESFFRSSKSRTFESAFDKPELKQESDHPVVCVSWDDAADFARWLEAETGKPYRLPRAAEFEALARASKPAACHANLADNRYDAAFSERDAFKCDDGYAATAKVRSFEADSNGLYDIAGNVREWAGDCAGSCKAHLAMGSAWLSPSDKSESAQRQNFDSDLSLNSVGFRVVRDVD
jgi:formylglycine-generating enzyme required for sulfatase activity